MHFFYTKQCSVVWIACNNSKRWGCKGATFQERSWQRSDVPRTLLTIAITLALTIKQMQTHRYFPFAFMWYIICQKDPSKIFSVIQDENSGSNDEEGKLLDSIAWPCRQTSTQKYCMWWFYRKFSSSGGTHTRYFPRSIQYKSI